MRRCIGIILGVMLSATVSFGALVASEDFTASDAVHVALENKSSQSGTGFGSNVWFPDSYSTNMVLQHVGGHAYCLNDTTTYTLERDFESSYAVPTSGSLYFSAVFSADTDSSSINKTSRTKIVDAGGNTITLGMAANVDGTMTIYGSYPGSQVTFASDSSTIQGDWVTLVLKLDFDSNEMTMWVNPTGEETGDLSKSTTFTPGTDAFIGLQLTTAGGSKDGQSRWDYAAFGTTWADIEPPQSSVLIAAEDFSATDAVNVSVEGKSKQSGIGFGYNTWIPDSYSTNMLIQDTNGYVYAEDDVTTYVVQRDFESSLAVPTDGSLYFCAVISAETDSASANKTTRMKLVDSDGGTSTFGLSANTDGTTTIYGNHAGSQIAFVNQSIVTQGDWITLVLKMDFDSNEITFWVNPTGEESGGKSGSKAFTPVTSPFVGMQMTTAGASRDGTSGWDFAAFGTSWDAVMPQTIPEAEMVATDDFEATDTVDVLLADKDPQSGSGFGSNAWIPDSNSSNALIQLVEGSVAAIDDTTTYYASRDFESPVAVPVSGVLYFAAVISAQTDSGSVNKTTRMDLLDGNDYVGRLGMAVNPDGTTTYYGGYEGDQIAFFNETITEAGEPVTMVLKVDYDSNKFTLMVNPTGDGEGGLVESRTFVAGSDPFTGMRIGTAGGGKDGTSLWDYVALADRWEEAVPQTAPSGILIASDDFEATDTVDVYLENKNPQSGVGFGSNVWIPDSISSNLLIQSVDGYVAAEDDAGLYAIRDFATPFDVPTGGCLYFGAIISAKTDSASISKHTRIDLMDTEDYVARVALSANTDGTITFYGNYAGQQVAFADESITAAGSYVTMVLKLDFDSNELTYWVNPTGEETGGLSGSKSFTPGTNPFTGIQLATPGVQRYGLSRWDYVAFGTSWDDVIGTPSGTPYELWWSQFPGIGDDTASTDDPDGDGVPNICEWALGGDPTDGADTGYGAGYDVKNVGSNVFEYVYAKRTDADSLGLSYHIEVTSNLTSGAWVSGDYAVGVGALDDDFNAVTNYVPMGDDASKFVRLVIE